MKKNVFNNLILVIFIFNFISCSAHGAGEKAVIAGGKALIESTHVVSDALIEVTTIATKGGIEMSQIAGDAGVKASEGIGLKSTEVASDAFSKIAIIAMSLYGVKLIIDIGRDAYTYFNPGEEKIARIKAARKINEIFDIEFEFKDCLLKNPKALRNSDGCPVACEELAQKFCTLVGRSELIEITENFKYVYRDSIC